jgi:BclA C-terminal domain
MAFSDVLERLENALAGSLEVVNANGTPAQIERLIRLLIKKEIVLELLLENVNAFQEAYGYVFNFPIQTVASGDEVNFSNNGPLVNIVHNPGDEAIFIPQAGDYLVEYTVAVDLNQASAYALILNNVEVPNAATRYGATSAGPIRQTMTGSVIISVPANSTLLLRNIGNTTDTLIGIDDGQGVVNASLSIHKLSAQ